MLINRHHGRTTKPLRGSFFSKFATSLRFKAYFPYCVIFLNFYTRSLKFWLFFVLKICDVTYCNYDEKERVDTLPILHISCQNCSTASFIAVLSIIPLRNMLLCTRSHLLLHLYIPYPKVEWRCPFRACWVR